MDNDLKAVIQAGIDLHLKGDLHGAMALYQVALELEPSNTLVLYNAACVFEEAGRPEEAKKMFELAARIGDGANDPDVQAAVRDYGKRGVN